MLNDLMASAFETALLASSTASWTLARSSESSARSATLASFALPCLDFQSGKASSSTVTSAAMNGFWSPTTMHWLTSGCARSRSSRTAGATFLPPAVTMSSFLRPVMRRYPSRSSSPMSPVWNQPPSSASFVASALLK